MKITVLKNSENIVQVLVQGAYLANCNLRLVHSSAPDRRRAASRVSRYLCRRTFSHVASGSAAQLPHLFVAQMVRPATAAA